MYTVSRLPQPNGTHTAHKRRGPKTLEKIILLAKISSCAVKGVITLVDSLQKALDSPIN